MFKARSGSYVSQIIFIYFLRAQFANSKISYFFVYHEASARIPTALSILSCFLLAFIYMHDKIWAFNSATSSHTEYERKFC